MPIWKEKRFAKWQQKMKMTNKQLVNAVREMKKGLIDADLGHDLVKKRIARNGSGKRDGFRTIVATKLDDRWFFLTGYAKNEKEDLSDEELEVAKEMAHYWLNLSKSQIDKAVKMRFLVEVKDE